MLALVTPDNFDRAESDTYFRAVVGRGGFGRFEHNRDVANVYEQTVVRSNRDTLYSTAVFDLDAGPVRIRLPDAGDRFMSLIAINEDHYARFVFYDPGEYTFSRENMGTRYALVAIRILVDPNHPADLAIAHALQDAIRISPRELGTFIVPEWDPASHKKVRDALLQLAETIDDSHRMFGPESEVDAIRHLIGTTMGFGGNPERDALYLSVVPEHNDGKAIYTLTVGDVPVDGFWSISVYNSRGYFEPNLEEVYSINNVTAKKSPDGSVTVQFGGEGDATTNVIPIVRGWNYMVRLYRPRPEILSGAWVFPEAQLLPM